MDSAKIIDEVLKHLKLNPSQLSKSLGLKRAQNIYDIQKGKTGISKDVAARINETYPEINKHYLLTGEGQLLNENTILASSNQNNRPDGITAIPYDDYMMVEYEDLATAAGYLGVDDLEILPDTKKRLIPKEFERGKYLVVRVDGHSMDDGTSKSIPDGTEILIRELQIEPGKRLPIRNNLFVIVSHDGVVLKQVVEHDVENGFIRCHSYNPDFKDYLIACDDIIQIFLYRKIVSFRPPIPDIEK